MRRHTLLFTLFFLFWLSFSSFADWKSRSQMENYDGSLTEPAISFSTDDSSGFYLIGSDSIGVVIGGVLIATVHDSGMTISQSSVKYLSNYANLDSAIASIGSKKVSLVLDTPDTISGNVTIVSNIAVTATPKGVVYTTLATDTLFIQGSFYAGNYKCFNGRVVFSSGSVDYVVPEWWGVDGTADQTEINYALNATPISVYLPSTTYAINAVIDIPAGKHLFGNGPNTIITSSIAGADTCSIRILGDSVVVRDLHLRGVGRATPDAQDRGILSQKRPADGDTTYFNIIKNCTIDNFKGGGINGIMHHCKIQDNHIFNMADMGIWLSSNCKANLVSGNVIHDVDYSGIDCNGSENRIINNEIYNCGGGVKDKVSWAGVLIWYNALVATGPYRADENIVSDNVLYDNKIAGIIVGGNGSTGADTTHPRGNILKGNLCVGHSDTTGNLAPAGITIVGAKGTIIKGNTLRNNFYNCFISGWWGYDNSGCQILGNNSFDAIKDGFYFADSGGYYDLSGVGHINDVMLADNYDYDASRDGFRWKAHASGSGGMFKGWQISGNRSLNAGAYGFNLVDSNKFVQYSWSSDNIATGAGIASHSGIGIQTLPVNSTTPNVSYGRIFKTANTNSTKYTNFANPSRSQEIMILVEDANTSFDFTSNANMEGNGGYDYVASNGDIINAVYDGKQWKCDVQSDSMWRRFQGYTVHMDGNIGIGKKIPTVALDVVGSVSLTGNIAATAGSVTSNRFVLNGASPVMVAHSGNGLKLYNAAETTTIFQVANDGDLSIYGSLTRPLQLESYIEDFGGRFMGGETINSGEYADTTVINGVDTNMSALITFASDPDTTFYFTIRPDTLILYMSGNKVASVNKNYAYFIFRR